jgi:site-specific DNA-methyltransferase (adenine-specific)
MADREHDHGPQRTVYEDDAVSLVHADCRSYLSFVADLIVTDPPYGDTSLEWDVPVDGWVRMIDAPQVWCFGSMRFWMRHAADFEAAGFKYGQEVVWEKHNGSGFHADRFKRVHELAVHWYRGEWSSLHHEVPVTMDATPRTVRRKGRPAHTGHIDNPPYTSEDGGPKLMRSVQYVRSEHGRAIHPTQKPTGILRPLIEYSCPPGGVVLDPFAGFGVHADRGP